MFPFIHIGDLEISTWRIVVLAGIITCWVLSLIRSKKLGYSSQAVFLWLLFSLPVGTLGGHLFNKIIPSLMGVESASQLLSGLTVTGSIIFCVLFSLIYIRYVIKVPPLPLLDAVAFTFPLSILIGRIGCLTAGCCYGRPAPVSVKNSVLSLFTLPAGSYAPPSHAWEAYQSLPKGSVVWDLPLLLMLNVFFVLAITEIMYRNAGKWRLYPGTVFAATCCLYTAGRFPIEFLRMEEVVGGALLNPWQLTTLALFFISLFWLGFSLYKRFQLTTRGVE
jgi:phosphatidylglycerol:prolipoprotein diacylglycerol transferase